MRNKEDIKVNYPTLYNMLGDSYINKLESEQGALSERATINPFFNILYDTSNNQESELIESCFKEALNSNSISLEKLRRRFRNENNHVNIRNFINEIVALRPTFIHGKFLVETGESVMPDFLANISESEVVFECVSVNEAANSKKQRNKDITATKNQHKTWKTDNPNGGVFTAIHEVFPYGNITPDRIIEKIRKKKSSRQVKDFHCYKVLVMSFRNMMFAKSSECLPHTSNNVDGIHSGLIYHAFYGKKEDVIFQGNTFEGERHKLSILKSDGKFSRSSDYNLCIVNFEAKPDEMHKQYVFLENLQNSMPEELINSLIDIFSPYETHSIIKKYAEE